MKKFLKFAGLVSLCLAALAFIFMMAGHALEYSVKGSLVSASGWYSGVAVIFGKGPYEISGSIAGIGGTGNGTFEGKLAWTALLAWIFALAAMIILLLGVILPLLKIKVLEKFAGLLNLIAVGLLVVGGIFMFFTLSAFARANEWSSQENWALNPLWIIGGILYIVAGAVAIAPAAAAFFCKKK